VAAIDKSPESDSLGRCKKPKFKFDESVLNERWTRKQTNIIIIEEFFVDLMVSTNNKTVVPHVESGSI
jgi:hypothetical protein